MCLVITPQSEYRARKNCEYESMILGGLNGYFSDLTLFAFDVYNQGGNIWIEGKNGSRCSYLSAPEVLVGLTTEFTKKDNTFCFMEYASVCEYDSK